MSLPHYPQTIKTFIIVSPGLPLLLPNAFSPNGDGHNNIFRIPPGVELSLTEFEIFDRWGNLVSSTNNINTGWDGTYKEVPAEKGV